MRTSHPLTTLSIALMLASGAALAHEDEGKGQVGRVKFASSCSAEVQPTLETGVAMLHSFWYSATLTTFADVLARDPSCTIAQWGIAAILMGNPLAGQGALPKDAVTAQAAIDAGRSKPPGTQRERDYIEAVAAYYRDFATRSERARQASRSEAFEALAAKYPDDDEAQIFSALYIAGTQSQADQSYAAYKRAAGILEKQFKRYPDHPGVAHYLIHSYDAPPLAQQGVPAARLYASIAPAAPHALHMPSHIFTRIGAWEDSAATNRRSANSAKVSGEQDQAYHAMDYAVYAYLQLGRDAEARSAMQEVMQVQGFNPNVRTAPYAIAAMPARIALERGAWKEATQLQVQATRHLYPDAITHYARALGALRSGDLALADTEAKELERVHKALQAAGDTYWASEVEVQRLSVAAWTAQARANPTEAVRLMRAAADLEDRNEKHIVTPGRVLPARELLGDLLLEQKQPAEALREYETSQVREPNRFRSYYGAAVSAEASGDRVKASQYYGKLLELAKAADSPRAELVRARAFVAQR